MVKNTSLLETLNELGNLSTVNIKDPEDEDFEKGRISLFGEAVDEKNTSDKTFGKLRKAIAHEDEVDKKYSGVKGSRGSLVEWSEDSDENVEDENSVTGSTKDGNGRYIEKGGDDDDDYDSNDDDNVDSDSDGDNDSNDDVDSDSDGDNDGNVDVDSDGDNDGDNDVIDNSMNIDFSKLPDDLKSVVSQAGASQAGDGVDGMENFVASLVDDSILKGQSTKTQLDILDKLLESRIRLQKSLHLCNQLPQHETMGAFKEQAVPQIKETYECAKHLVKELLNKLLKLQEVLCKTNCQTSSILTTGALIENGEDEEIPSDTEDEDENCEEEVENERKEGLLDLPSKRKHTLTVADYGEEICKRHKAMQQFQHSTITKWYEKTRLVGMGGKTFASFDHSALQQIQRVLLDKDKLIKRTQLSRVPLNILGKESNEQMSDTNLHLQHYDENIFDDGDFYHEMLKELIERKCDIDTHDPIAAGRRWLELQKLRLKMKRKVDTRASKGRKVRYAVHTKLISFMAPQNVASMSNLAINDLFASLFARVSTGVDK